jgi:hypothetical protein
MKTMKTNRILTSLCIGICCAGIQLKAGEATPAENEAKIVFDYSFNAPVKKGFAPKPYNKVYINPSPGLEFNGSANTKHDGKGSIGLVAGKTITMDSPILESGKVYTMTAWVKTNTVGSAASIAFFWFKKNDARSVFRVDNNKIKLLDTDWHKIEKTVKAPDYSHVYFQCSGGSKTDAVWFSNLTIVEE